jgi:hypothetical protein
MPKQGDVHVVQQDSGKWAVKVEGNQRVSSTHDTQSAATQAGRKVARSNSSELLVHGRDGQIRERNSYGRDPRASKG